MNVFASLSPFYSRRLIVLTLLVSGALHWLMLLWPSSIVLAGQPNGETRYKVSLRYEAFDQLSVSTPQKVQEKVLKDLIADKKQAEKAPESPKNLADKSNSKAHTLAKKSLDKTKPVVEKRVENEAEMKVEKKSREFNKTQKEKAVVETVRKSVNEVQTAQKSIETPAKKIEQNQTVEKQISQDVKVVSELPDDRVTDEQVQKTVQQELTDESIEHQQVEPAHYEIGSANNPKPYYPAIARKRGWEGDVVLGVNVAADGSIDSLIIIKGATYSALTHAAWETVKDEWSFKAAMKEGRAIASYIEVPISFRLTN